MKADICDVCERKMDKQFGSFYTKYSYWEEMGYQQKGPSDELELCEWCRDQLLIKVNEIRHNIDLQPLI